MILESQDDWDFDDKNRSTNYPVATTPMVSGQRDYVFPGTLKILKIKRVDVTYDGSTYYRAQPFDSSETRIPLGNDTTVDGNFAKSAPYYDVRSDAVWLYPLPNATDVAAGGLVRVEFLREITEFTTTDLTTGTAEPGFDEMFHILIPLGMCLDFASAKGLIMKNDVAAELQDNELRLRRYYGRKNEDRMPILKWADVDYS